MAIDPRRPTSRNRPATGRHGSPLDNLRKPSQGLPNLGTRPATARNNRPTTSRNLRPSTSRQQRGGDLGAGEEGELPPPPPKKNNTPIIVGAAIGGVVLLLIIVAAASGGGKSSNYRHRSAENDYKEPEIPKYEPEKPKEVLKFDGQAFRDTGALLFICANTSSHEDKEVEINFCPQCQKKNFFCGYRGKIVCWNCEADFPVSNLICPDCKRPPQKSWRIKHK